MSETANIRVTPPSSNFVDQRVSKKVRKTRNTTGIKVARLVSKNFRPRQDVCRILKNRVLGNPLWRVINIEVVSDPVPDERTNTERFQIRQALALPKGVYFHTVNRNSSLGKV